MLNNAYYRVFFRKVALAFALYTFLRLLFVLFNWQFFRSVKLSYFLYGIRFDWVAVTYLFLPFVFFSIIPLPHKIKTSKKYVKWLNFWYWVGIVISTIANFVDIIYFRFTLKRTTADVFKLFSDSTETWSLLPMFLVHYWYLLLLFLVIMYFFVKLIKAIDNQLEKKQTISMVNQALIFVLISGLIILGVRGGAQHKPVTIINAGEYAEGIDANIVLNTPFTLLKTLFEEQLEPHTYFESKEEMKRYFNPVRNISPFKNSLKDKNVMILILESFGKEYISYFNKEHTLTPFLDSLFSESVVFAYSYANGRKSIEALPAIFSSVPALMNTPFIVSNYAGNEIESLPKKLKKYGYSTHFFHGGKNGRMSFDAFCFAAGIDHYYGYYEYPDKDLDFDGNWGIYDEPYLQYVANCLDTVKLPFFASVFTLSSHHPFKVPEKYKAKFNQMYDGLAISPTIQYTDYALRRFFASAKYKKWFQNTVFIITADHTSISKHLFYKNSLGVYNVPIVIYSPGKNMRNAIDTTNLVQHIDIYPTVLSLLGKQEQVFAFGTN
ncbi:MAG TPA: sulfatase, partial [Flavobacteriales bacterium]|nr:sulfatase [Flavobacteriales bacterium]